MNRLHQADIARIVEAEDSKRTIEEYSRDCAHVVIESCEGVLRLHIVLDSGQKRVLDTTYQYTLAQPLPGGIDTFSGEMDNPTLHRFVKLVTRIGTQRAASAALTADMLVDALRHGCMDDEPTVLIED